MRLPKITSLSDRKLEDRLKKTLVFLGKLILIGLIFQLIVHNRPDTQLLQSWLASITGYLLSIIEIELETQGALLLGSQESYLVTQDCLGWKSAFAFLGLMIASTKNILDDLSFILTGAIALLAINILRVFTTVYLSYNDIISFDIIHTVLWRWGLTLLVLIFWSVWLFEVKDKLSEHLNTGTVNSIL